jgi:hypothetical protein
MTNTNHAGTPTISLVIPAYNEEAYLPACLEAVMRNVGDQAMEIIVIDNNSTDGTRQVVERYPRVTYVFEPQKGITRARQRGFQAASGDIMPMSTPIRSRPRAGSSRSASNSPPIRGWPACRAPTASTIWAGFATRCRRGGSWRRGRSTG